MHRQARDAGSVRPEIFATRAKLKKYLAIFSYLVFCNTVNLLRQIFFFIWANWLFPMAKYWTNNVDIWSHCKRHLLGKHSTLGVTFLRVTSIWSYIFLQVYLGMHFYASFTLLLSWAFPGLLFFIFVFFVRTVYRKYWFNKSCCWLDMNRGTLMFEATALPTEQQTLSSFCTHKLFDIVWIQTVDHRLQKRPLLSTTIQSVYNVNK